MNPPEHLAIATLGRFLGITELLSKQLITPERFAKRCQEIAQEYADQKAEISK